MRVRDAERSDVHSLTVIRQQALEAGLTGEYERSAIADLVTASGERLDDWIHSSRWHVLVGESDVTPVAFGTLDTETGQIAGVYTAPAHQGRGAGRRLVSRLEERAQSAGLRHVCADAPVTAVGFFEALGFERETTVSGDIERVRMRKPLTAAGGSPSPDSPEDQSGQ